MRLRIALLVWCRAAAAPATLTIGPGAPSPASLRLLAEREAQCAPDALFLLSLGFSRSGPAARGSESRSGAPRPPAPAAAERQRVTAVEPYTLNTETGGPVTVQLAADIPASAKCRCELVHHWDGWKLVGDLRASCTRQGPRSIRCGLPPIASEGPYGLQVSVGEWATTFPEHQQLWYATPFAVSFDRQPYFAASRGELLVRTNVSSAPALAGAGGAAALPRGALRVVARSPGGRTLLNEPVTAVGHAALPVLLSGFPESFSGSVEVNLTDAEGRVLASRLVRLVRVPKPKRGSTAVDFKRRAILVDRQPFFPISWFSTYLSFGLEATVTSLRDMARHGANSVMIYNLVSKKTVLFEDREPPLPGAVLDAAATLGIKVHIYLLDLVLPLAQGTSNDWYQLERTVQELRDHPAVLSWYVADDNAGHRLPEVYRRIKALDPYHLVVVAIQDPADGHLERFRRGSDLIMLETYATDAWGAYDTMNRLRRWPTEFMPAVTCGRAWSEGDTSGMKDAVISPQMFRSQAYNALAAGTTGEMWFAYRNADGWNEPGIPLQDAGGAVARELLDLVPSLLSAGSYDAATAMPEVTSAALLQGGGLPRDNALRARAFREESGCVNLLMVNSLTEPLQALVNFSYGSPGIFDDSTKEAEAIVPFEKASPERRVTVRGGRVSEWLPALGVQVFRFSGTGDCAASHESSPQATGLLQDSGANPLANPSFERSQAYISAPDGWDCDMAPPPKGLLDSSCFADTHVAKDGRHSGRFTTGSNPYAFRVRPSFNLRYSYPYRGSIWAMANSPMELLVMQERLGWEDEVARLRLTDSWQQVHFNVTLSREERLIFKVTRPGVFWLDRVELQASS